MRKDIEKILYTEPMILTRPGWTYHPPVTDENGKLRLGFPEHEAFIEINKKFYDAGVRVCLSNLPVGWIDEDEYIFDSMDETLEKLFKAVPNALYIPRLRLDPPFKWLEKHPEEVCVFEDGPRDTSEIAKLVKKGCVNNTYNMDVPPQANGLQPLRLEEPIGLQSFSSKLWVKDACKALEATINHILNGPYAKHFIGFHICFGGTCELLHWGNGGSKIGDFSVKHTHDFFDWALSKYGSLEALKNTWDLPNLTRENAFVPPASWRKAQSTTPQSAFKMDGKGFMHRDYELFHSQMIVDAFLELAKVSKKLAPDLAVGMFYGYECYGHEHMDRILSSPYVDYISAPKPYFDPQPGGKGGSGPRVASVMHKKLFIEEIDNRVHTAYDPRKFASHINTVPAQNITESANVLWREICKLEQVNANWWWMDQGDAKHRWYADDELMHIVAEQAKVHKALKENKAKSISEVFCISDTNANYYGGIKVPMRTQLLYTGIPHDEYRMSDIDEIDLSNCKLLIFYNPQLLTKQKLEQIQKRISKDCQIIFSNLPGVCNPDFCLERVFELTGMKVSYNPDPDAPAPIFTIDHGADKIIYKDTYGVRIAKKENITLILNADITPALLTDIIKSCGVKSIIPQTGVVHGNSKILGVFSTKESGIEGTVSLPQKTDWFEWFTKTEYKCTDAAYISINPKEARVFIAKDLL